MKGKPKLLMIEKGSTDTAWLPNGCLSRFDIGESLEDGDGCIVSDCA